MEVRVLGDLVVVDGARVVELRPLERRVIQALVVARPAALSYDALADAVWGDRVPGTAKHSLQAHVQRVRSSAGTELVATAHDGYRLGADVAVDADAFEAAAERAGAAGSAAARREWDAALSIWRGRPFPDLDDWAPAGIERDRLVELWNRAAEERCAAALAERPGADLVGEADRLVQAEPLRERRWELLMTALDAAGRRAEALRAFDRARRTLAGELGISPGTELARLHESLLRDEATPTEAPTSTRRSGALPAVVTSIVGRDEDLDAVGRAFEQGRLVTLTGPAGVGKTRLALAHATHRRAADDGPVRWVELAPVREAAAVEALVASTLGLPGGAGGPATTDIVAAIGDARLLVVLDNCEHLLEATASLAARLVTSCPRTSVLATSREPLAIPGERLVAVAPLPTDGAAVDLFVERARAADPGFDATDGDAVAAISRRLDGIPLAIELAAARVRTLGVRDVAARLDQRFDVVAAAPRRGPDDRHHTMRAALDWSHDLLGEDERAVFAQLAVFRGRFELDAVERVVDGVDGDVVDTLVALVDKSMVVADGTAAARFRLLEPVRQFAAERLDAAGGADAAAWRHAHYFAELAVRLNREQRGRGEIEAFARIDAARDNFRAAFDHAVDHGDVATALALPVYLHRYGTTHVWSEPWAWSETALALPGAPDHPLYAAAHLAALDGAWQTGRYEDAIALGDRAVLLLDPASEEWREAKRLMAGALVWLRRFDDAEAAAAAAVDGQPDAVTDASLSRITTLLLIRNAIGRPEPDMARQALADARILGNATTLALAYHTAGVVLGHDDHELGMEYQREAARLAAATGAALIEGFALGTLAALVSDEDPLGGARAQLDVMRHYLRVGNRTHLRSFGRGLIARLVDLGADEAAAVVDGATRDQPELGELAISRSTSAARVRAVLGPAYADAADRGAAMTDDELVAYVESVVAALEGGSSEP